MRLAAQAKGGFYPTPPAALAAALRWLEPPRAGRFCIFDPCCGVGDAILQLADGLGCAMQNVYAVELDELRSEHAQQKLAAERGCQVLGPASFFGTGISRKSFSLIWCNPPFDDELGGGKRVELSFLQQATYLLVSQGVMAFVCPEYVIDDEDVRGFLLSWFAEIRVVEFPAEHRKFEEVVVIAVRRETQVPCSADEWRFLEAPCSADDGPTTIYRLPRSPGPKRFERTEMTEREILAALALSPLRRHLEPVKAPPLPSPPLPLGNGHRALLLAAGQLDGRVFPPGELPHVVRGTAVKRRQLQTVDAEERDDGEYTKTVIAEKIVLTVRVATATGEILTLTQDGEPEEEQTEVSVRSGAVRRHSHSSAGRLLPSSSCARASSMGRTP